MPSSTTHQPSDLVDLTEQLNDPQRQAVFHDGTPLLVYAGAGSGKTRIITFRVARLLALQRVAPWEILTVTFTNKAAKELRERLERLVGPHMTAGLWVGTFHSTCARLLRRYHQAVGLPRDFTIYDQDDQKALLKRIYKDRKLDDKQFKIPMVLASIRNFKRDGLRPDNLPAPSTPYETVVAELYDAYQTQLRAANALDFDDLILETTLLAERPNHPDAQAIRSLFSHVLVDEFQDVNQLQYRLVRALAARDRNICVVGDDDQSIYGWRGADVRIIRGFRSDFPDTRVIKLEQNYRSTGNIVRSAQAVISHAVGREEKNLFTERPDGDPIRVLAAFDEHGEARLVAQTIRQALDNGIPSSEIAVFYRIHALSRVLEEGLRLVGIPYRIIGGTRFFDRKEIKDVLAYLRVIANPSSNVDLLRIINVPRRGIGNSTIDRIARAAMSSGRSLFDTMALDLPSCGLSAAPRKRVATFVDLIQDFRTAAEEFSLSDLLDKVIDESGYIEQLRSENSAEADARIENIEELRSSVAEFELEMQAAGEVASLTAYLERASLLSAVDEEAQDAVSLMTVHAAKGLEFDTVIVTGLEEDLFPYHKDTSDELEEERRLAYVAITRARNHLFLTHATSRMLFGKTCYQMPSRFLEELPEEIVEQIIATGQPAATGYRSRASARGSAADAPYAPLPWDYEIVDESPPDDLPLVPGVFVSHKRFGEGKIVQVDQSVNPPLVHVDFPDWGVKRVLATYLVPRA